MEGVERLENCAHPAQCVALREGTFRRLDALLQRVAGDVFHHQIAIGADDEVIVIRGNARGAGVARDPGKLAHERDLLVEVVARPLALIVRQRGVVEHIFQCPAPAVAQVLDEIDAAHAALAERADQTIATSEGRARSKAHVSPFLRLYTAHEDGGDIVLATIGVSGGDQALTGLFDILSFGDDAQKLRIADHLPQAVAAEQ